jgi:hypothetical protein
VPILRDPWYPLPCKIGNGEYTLRPREFGDNYPVSFDEEGLKSGRIRKKSWRLMSVGRGRYLVKNEKGQRCLYKTLVHLNLLILTTGDLATNNISLATLFSSREDRKVEEHDCRIWSPNQEWVCHVRHLEDAQSPWSILIFNYIFMDYLGISPHLY